ncbi:MAG: hypothetical protein M3550_13030 [Actinomycetota bacterium]|nr:hypothetical protein [Actinomycetota bacterium]
MGDLRGLLGLAAILALTFLVSNNRGRIPWRTVAVGLAIQVAFAALVLRWSVGRDVLDFVAGQVKALIDYTNDGTDFLFGELAADEQETIFALQVLPVIIFLGALVGLLYYLRVIQWVVEIGGGAIASHALGAVRGDDGWLRVGGRLDPGRLRAAGGAASLPARRHGDERTRVALHRQDDVPRD